MIYVCAPTDEAAAERANRAGVSDWRRVGPNAADIEGAVGHLLLSHDWRDTFTADNDAPTFLAAAHRQAELLVEPDGDGAGLPTIPPPPVADLAADVTSLTAAVDQLILDALMGGM